MFGSSPQLNEPRFSEWSRQDAATKSRTCKKCFKSARQTNGLSCDRIGDSTWQLTYKTWPFSNYGEVSKHIIHNYLTWWLEHAHLFQLYIFVGLDFFRCFTETMHAARLNTPFRYRNPAASGRHGGLQKRQKQCHLIWQYFLSCKRSLFFIKICYLR